MGFFGKTEGVPQIVNNYHTAPEKAEPKKEAPKKGPLDGAFDEYIVTAKKVVVVGLALYATYYVASTFYSFGVQRTLSRARNLGLNTQKLEKDMNLGVIDQAVVSSYDRIEDSISDGYKRIEATGREVAYTYGIVELGKIAIPLLIGRQAAGQ